MLELVRARLNRTDDLERYAEAIRTHLELNGGQFGAQGRIRDKTGHPSL